MSAVALNISPGPQPSSLEAARDPGRQPSGAFSFSSILKGMDQQDAPSNGSGSPVGAVASAENAPASQVGTTEKPTTASDPFSIEAGLAALGYGQFDESGGSLAAGSAPASSEIPGPTAASSAASPANRNMAPSGPATTRNPSSIEAVLAALGYGPSDASEPSSSPVAASPGAPSQTVGASGPAQMAVLAALGYGPSDASEPFSSPVAASPGAPSQSVGASGPAQKAVAAPTGQAGLSSRTVAAPAPPAGSSSDIASGQDATPVDSTATSDPQSTGATPPALAYNASETPPGARSGPVSPGSGASGEAQKRVVAAQRQAASIGRINPTTSPLSLGPVSQVAITSDRTQSGGVGSQGGASSPARTNPGLATLGSGASDTAQGAPSSMLVPQDIVSLAAVQGMASQGAASPAPVSQGVVSGDVGASVATQKAATVPQYPTGPVSRQDSNLAALSGAADIASPLVANVTDAVSNAAAANPLTADPSLGLQSLQSRTHLAMTNALPVRTTGSERSAAASTSAPAIAAAAASSTSPATTAQPVGGEPVAPRPAPAQTSPVAVDATAATAPISPASSLAVAGPGIDPGSSGLASIPLSGFADFVADQASSLTSPSPASAPTASAAAPQAVKELEISLDPANLGAVSVKMRLANGKLSIVIGVSNSSTLAAIENERGAIAERLGSTQQPLENLVIMSRQPSNESSQDFAQTASGGNDASDQGSPSHAKSNDNSSSAQRGDGGFARGRNDAPAANGSTEPASGGGPRALLV